MQTTVTRANGTIEQVKNLGWLEHHRQEVQLIVFYTSGNVTVVTEKGDIVRTAFTDTSVREDYFKNRFKDAMRVVSEHAYEEWTDLITIPAKTILVGFVDNRLAQVFPALLPKLGPIAGLQMSEPGAEDKYYRWLLSFPTLKQAVQFKWAFYEIFNNLNVQIAFAYLHLNHLPFIGLETETEVYGRFRKAIDETRKDGGLPAFDWNL